MSAVNNVDGGVAFAPEGWRMGRVIAAGPGGRAQAPARDDRYRPVLELVLARNLLGAKLLSPPCRDWAAADDARRGLYRSARYFCSCGKIYCTRKHTNIDGCPNGGQRVSCRADIVAWADPADGKRKLCVQFRVWRKEEGIRQVVADHGPDPNTWPYFARRKQLKPRRKS